jgi:outer membrane protein TolC
MSRAPRSTAFVCAAVGLVLSGCVAERDYWNDGDLRVLFANAPTEPPAKTPASSPLTPAAATTSPAPSPLAPANFGNELSAEAAIKAVLERNPGIDEMRAAAEAAAARYQQVTSLDDPGFSFNTAPGSAWSANTAYAARVEFSQKFLYPGKRNLKGQIATAEAEAASQDVDDLRLSLIAATKSAVADYFLAEKGHQVAMENQKLLREFRQNAETRYKNGVGQQQDMLQADVELARIEERLVAVRRIKQVAIARLNTLMHASPDHPLPPPAEIHLDAELPEAPALRALAARSRPDFKAASDRLTAEESALALAQKEYKPDFELMTAYDGFWQGQNGRPLQWQIGARMNLPVRYARRTGAVMEAQAKVVQRRAEVAKLADRINYEVQESWEQVREAEEVVRLYAGKILPAAEANVKEAQSGYVAGRVQFLNLVEAQRNRIGLRNRYYEATAESLRRRAALERVVGKPLTP